MGRKKKSIKPRYINENLELIMNIKGFKFDVALSDEYESDDGLISARDYEKKIKDAANLLGQDIWIDKTYVDFKGTRWQDAFIMESGWKDLIKMLQETEFGEKEDKDTEKYIQGAIIAIVITYMYTTLEKMGYSSEDFTLSQSDDTEFSVAYIEDTRKEWLY